jgi:hypothetical protein
MSAEIDTVVVGRLEQVQLREIWQHEERGFSVWLQKNLDVLSAAVGIEFLNPERELEAGDFSADLVVETGNGERAIIENQLETTDHDHLGKVITYLTNLDAKIAIWIAKQPRSEHIRAVQWLNEVTPDDVAFYLVKLSAYRISGSPPAPLFTVIVGPSKESKDFGKQKKDLAERHVLRLKFWEGLLSRAKQKGVMWHAQRSATKESWIGAGAGVRAGVSLNYVIWKDGEGCAELYIDTGDAMENKRIFNNLWLKREEIEDACGQKLEWDRLDDKRASRVRFMVTAGGLSDGEERWPDIQDAMIDAMDRLAKAVLPVVRATK